MALLKVDTSFNIDLQFETTAFHIRFFAWLIDLVILIFFFYGMSNLLDTLFDIDMAGEYGIIEIMLITPFISYHLICELALKGQSLGKKLLGIQVIGMSGQGATASQYLLRWLLRFIDFGFVWGFIFLLSRETFLGTVLFLSSIISFILFVTSPYQQRLGDRVAGTTVVMKKLPYKLSDTIFQELDVNDYKVSFPDVMRLSDKDINIVDNIVKHHQRSKSDQYIQTVAFKIKTVLKIESDMPDDLFLEQLLRDYNYLSRK
ncbi:MAG: RDD family protein [Chitinophagaceae bacterium]|nr:RDD family protein [Chitinophagaceae bacterium]